MNALYNISVHIAIFMAKCIAVFNPKVKSFFQDRKNQKLPDHLQGCIWIHAASLGEFEQGRPVIEAIKQKWPNQKIALTFFSGSGYKAQKNYKYADWVGYMPIDTYSFAVNFLDQLNPTLVLFIKYEFWYNHLSVLITKRIPFVFISTYWWQDHFLLKSWNKWLMNKVMSANHIFVQDHESEKLLKQTGYTKITIAGDTRIDSVLALKNKNKRIEKFEGLNHHQLFIAGSTWPPDEKILYHWFKRQNVYSLIIAPHDVSAKHLSQIKEKFKPFKPLLYSDWNGESFSVLIIDSIGLLKTLYRYATIAYIGGGFGKGIHNILEPSVYHIPVLFGPNHKSFKEANDMIREGIGFEAKSGSELMNIINSFNKKTTEKISYKSKKYFEENQGATDKILSYIEKTCITIDFFNLN